jgi:DNA-binding MarR family transcriptional regulator
MAYEQLLLEHQLCFRLYTASRLTVQAYEPFLRELDITYTQYLALLVLWEKDEQPINDIGKRLRLGINTTSPLIKRMEKLGLVARRGNDEDKRQQVVFLTEKGKAMQQKAATIPSCMGELMEGCGVDGEEFVKIAPILDDYIAKLEQRQDR